MGRVATEKKALLHNQGTDADGAETATRRRVSRMGGQ